MAFTVTVLVPDPSDDIEIEYRKAVLEEGATTEDLLQQLDLKREGLSDWVLRTPDGTFLGSKDVVKDRKLYAVEMHV